MTAKGLTVMKVSGEILILGALAFGPGGTVLAMLRAFYQIQFADETNVDRLADGIGASLVRSAFLIPFLLTGVVLLVLARLLRGKQKAEQDS